MSFPAPSTRKLLTRRWWSVKVSSRSSEVSPWPSKSPRSAEPSGSKASWTKASGSEPTRTHRSTSSFHHVIVHGRWLSGAKCNQQEGNHDWNLKIKDYRSSGIVFLHEGKQRKMNRGWDKECEWNIKDQRSENRGFKMTKCSKMTKQEKRSAKNQEHSRARVDLNTECRQ